MSAVSEKQLGQAEKKFITFEAMIGKMTDEEKENPDLLAVSISRRRRIAKESGFKESDVAELLAQFTGMRQQAKMMSKRMKLSGMGQNPSQSPPTLFSSAAEQNFIRNLIFPLSKKQYDQAKVLSKRMKLSGMGQHPFQPLSTVLCRNSNPPKKSSQWRSF
jgi:hypothetical protein